MLATRRVTPIVCRNHVVIPTPLLRTGPHPLPGVATCLIPYDWEMRTPGFRPHFVKWLPPQ